MKRRIMQYGIDAYEPKRGDETGASDQDGQTGNREDARHGQPAPGGMWSYNGGNLMFKGDHAAA